MGETISVKWHLWHGRGVISRESGVDGARDLGRAVLLTLGACGGLGREGMTQELEGFSLVTAEDHS